MKASSVVPAYCKSFIHDMNMPASINDCLH